MSFPTGAPRTDYLVGSNDLRSELSKSPCCIID